MKELKIYTLQSKPIGFFNYATKQYHEITKYKTVQGFVKYSKEAQDADIEVSDADEVQRIKRDGVRSGKDTQTLLYSVLSRSERLKQSYLPIVLAFMNERMIDSALSQLDAKHKVKMYASKAKKGMDDFKRNIRRILPEELYEKMDDIAKEIHSQLSTDLFMLEVQLKNQALKAAPNFEHNDTVVRLEIIRLMCDYIIATDESFNNLISTRLGMKYHAKRDMTIEQTKRAVNDLNNELVRGLKDVVFNFNGEQVAGVNNVDLCFSSLSKKIENIKWYDNF